MPGGTPEQGQAYANILAQLAGQYGGVLAAPAVEHSQLLSNALQQMSQAGPTIRTGGALASNLLAEALLNFGRKRNDAELLKQINGGVGQRISASSIPGLDGPTDATGAPAAGPGAPPASGIATAPPTAGALGPQASPQGQFDPQTLAAHLGGMIGGQLPSARSQIDRDAATRMAWGEARGEGPIGQQAAVGVAMNRAAMTGQPLADIIAQPHQFAGYSPQAKALSTDSPAYEKIAGNLDPLLQGQVPNPAGTADHFYAPQGMPGGVPPSWARGQPMTPIGHQNFLSLGFDGHPAGSENASLSPSSPGNPSSDQPDLTPRPLQISTGPAPSLPNGTGQGPIGGGSPFALGSAGLPPSAGSGTGSGPPPSGVSPSSGAATPQATQFGQSGWQPPPVPFTQQQIADYHRLKSLAQQNPQYLQQFQDYSGQLQAQARTPEEIDISKAGDSGQMLVTGKRTGRLFGVQTPSGVIIPAGPKMVTGGGSDGAGPSVAPVPSTMPTTQGQFTPGTVTEKDAAGHTTVVQAPTFNPETARSAFLTAPEVQRYNDARTSTSGFFNLIQKATGNSGLTGVAAVNAVVNTLNPGTNPRTASNEWVLKSLGFPDWLQSQILKATGNGIVTVDSLKQMSNLALAYTSSEHDAAQRRMDSDTAAARAYDPKSNGVPGEMIPPVPAMPSFAGVGGGGGVDPQQVLQEARQAIAQGRRKDIIVQRLQTMGIDPGRL